MGEGSAVKYRLALTGAEGNPDRILTEDGIASVMNLIKVRHSYGIGRAEQVGQSRPLELHHSLSDIGHLHHHLI